MSIEEKILSLKNTSERVRNDCERLSLFLYKIRDNKYNNDVEGCEEKALDVDHAVADLLAIDSLLATLSLKVYSGEYTKELFELANISKSDFMSQINSLRDFYKSMSFLLSERQRLCRVMLDNRYQKSYNQISEES